MVKIGLSITIDLETLQKLKQESERSGKPISFLCNHYLKKSVRMEPSQSFYECRLCNEQKATEQDGLCSTCFAEKQKTEKERQEKEFNRILSVKVKKDEVIKEEQDKEKRELENQLKHAEEQFEDCLKNKKKWGKKYPKLSYKEQKELLENKIKRLKKELKDLCEGEKKDGNN